MGLTQIFLIMTVVSIALAIVFAMGASSVSDSLKPRTTFALAIISAIFIGTALTGVVGTFWSWNTNSRDSLNRCTESGGYVIRMNEDRVCLESAPVIKWKV